ncbi:RAD50-interacting protein 1-like [Watersipora subatra]|uniref:RAD50-interacting protein 1-like n=1 Tax=Watersipora subatra TaxID=2589382 RepID=UPI00355BC000
MKKEESRLKKKSAAQSEVCDDEGALISTPNITEQVATVEASVHTFQTDVSTHLETVNSSLSRLAELVDKAATVERCQAYLRCLDHIEHLSCSLQAAMLVDSIDKAIDTFEEFVSLREKLTGSTCMYLMNYLERTIRHWHKVLMDSISREMSAIMKFMEWPFIAAINTQKPKSSATSEPKVIKSNLSKIFKQLLRIQLPASIADESKLHSIIASLPGYKRPLLPMRLLVEPLRKRFKFHFYGNKQTNSLDKPEWFFTQLLTWAKNHAEYLSTVIQPALWDAGYKFVNANLEFLKALHMLATEKLISCMTEILYDEHLFSHLIHEALSFHSDMLQLHEYPEDWPSCLHALTAEEPFSKWIVIEKKFAQEKMDKMMTSSGAWTCQYNSELDDDDHAKTAECAESFIALLNAITERYEHLPYPVCQLMFVCMKQELLEDYRVRLVQLRKELSPSTPQYLAILNTAHHIISVLREWVEQPFFLKLQYQASLLVGGGETLSSVLPSLLSKNASYQLPQSIDESALEELDCHLFESSVDNICSLEREMIKTLTKHVVAELKTKLKAYADNNHSSWTGLPHLKHKDEQVMIGLSVTACDFLLHLQTCLQLTADGLHKRLFSRFSQQVAQELDSLIYTMVITANHFSEGGAIQLNFDMTRNLFPVIGKHTSKPENFLRRVKESCHLLTMQLGDALLLKETLYDSLHSMTGKHLEDPIALVQEQGVNRLSPEEVELVLSRRNDLLRNC